MGNSGKSNERNYGIIAIEPNLELKRAYENAFRGNIQVYRDKNTFDTDWKIRGKNSHLEFYKQMIDGAPLIVLMEASFAEELDDRLPDAPSIHKYPLRPFEKLTREELVKKSINLGLGLYVADQIRKGKYAAIDRNTPIISATVMNNNDAVNRMLQMPNTFYLHKDQECIGNKFTVADKDKLCNGIGAIVQDIIFSDNANNI